MSSLLISRGSILLPGLMASALAECTPHTRFTLLLMLGPLGLDRIPAVLVDRLRLIARVTLWMVGFLIDGKLSRHSLAHETVQGV